MNNREKATSAFIELFAKKERARKNKNANEAKSLRGNLRSKFSFYVSRGDDASNFTISDADVKKYAKANASEEKEETN